MLMQSIPTLPKLSKEKLKAPSPLRHFSLRRKYLPRRLRLASLALGQLDNEYTMDLAVSAGDELVIVHGRDRKLSLDETERAKVSPALVTQRKFPSNIASLVLGNFTGDSGTDVALLMDDGAVSVLSSGDAKAK